MPNELIIPTHIDIIPNFEARNDELTDEANRLDIRGDYAVRECEATLKKVIQLEKQIETGYSQETQVLRDVLRAYQLKKNDFLARTKAIREIIRQKREWLYQQEQEKRERLEKAAKEKKEQIELELTGEAKDVTLEMLSDELRHKENRIEANKVKNVRKYLKHEVINPSEVERDLCSPDDKKIKLKMDVQREAFESQGITDLKEIAEKIKIQGVKIYEEIKI